VGRKYETVTGHKKKKKKKEEEEEEEKKTTTTISYNCSQLFHMFLYIGTYYTVSDIGLIYI